MKKIVTMCFVFILSLQIFSNEMSKETEIVKEDLLIPETNNMEIVEESQNVPVAPKEDVIVVEEKEKTNKFLRIKGYMGLPGEVQGKAYNTDGTVKLTNLDVGIEGMVEGVYRVSKKTEVAMGLGIQQIGYLDTSYGTQENNYAVPFYFSGKHNLFSSPFYVKAILGVTYNYGSDDLKYFVALQEDPTWGITQNNIDFDNGLYGALGIGLDLWKFEVEGLYSVNTISANFTYNSEKYTRQLQNHRITIGASYAFDWNK